MKTNAKKKPTGAKKKSDNAEPIRMEGPMAEKDEVKQAEERTKKAQSKAAGANSFK